MDGRSRSPRSGGARPRGQHFIRSDAVAIELVRAAEVCSTDHVLEIGAGAGRLTRPLAHQAGRVTAIELDPELAIGLDRTFADVPTVFIVRGDVMAVPFPSAPWRAFGNVPFALTTPILRRLLDDVVAGPQRADLIVQFEAARKRASVERSTLLSLGWLPWWEIALTRRIPRLAFDPPPSVDAGVLRIERRLPALLDPFHRPAFVGMLGQAFDRGSWPVRRSLGRRLGTSRWKRLARDRGIPVDAPPAALTIWDWIAVFELFRELSTARS